MTAAPRWTRRDFLSTTALGIVGMGITGSSRAADERFAYIGVFSSGLLGAFPGGGRGAPAPAAPASAAPPAAAAWEKQHAAKLDDAGLRRGLRLLWFGTGKDDFLMPTTVATIGLFKRHGFAPVFVESPGGHTWINWRNYLAEFAPQLFRD